MLRNIKPMLRDINHAKWLAIGAAVFWLALSGWYQFTQFDTSYYYKSQYYVGSAQDIKIERDLADRTCWGSFEQRYECRSSIRLANQRQIFGVWVKKLFIVFGPPIILFAGYRYMFRARTTAARTKT